MSRRIAEKRKNEGFQLAATGTLLKLAVRLDKSNTETHSHRDYRAIYPPCVPKKKSSAESVTKLKVGC